MNIALFAYGSIIKHQQSQNYGSTTLNIQNEFQKTGFTLPLSFKRISSINTANERITLVPDSVNGLNTPVYSAPLQERSLNKAINQVKNREGTSLDKFISYVRRGQPRTFSTYSSMIIDNEKWSYRMQGFSHESIGQIIAYLKSNNFDAGIITTFEINASDQKLKTHLQISKVRDNTKAYLDDLPEDVKEVHELVLSKLF